MIPTILLQCIFIVLATVGLSINFNVKSNELIYCGLTGLTCYFFYMIVKIYIHHEFYGVIFGTFLGVILARRFSYVRKIPTTIYVIPAIVPLAPGGTLYLTMYNLINGNSVEAIINAFTTIKIAGGILIGLSIAFSLPNKLFNQKISERKR